MTRVIGLVSAGLLTVAVMLPATAHAAPQAASPAIAPTQTTQQAAPAAPKFTFSGDIALWTVAIKPDKTADFERIMARLRDALLKSEDPQRHRQAEGWKVMRLEKPLADGNIAYVHVINPVVPGADYTVMQALYEAFPDERQALYDTYRGAFAQNLSLASGSVVLDLSKAPQSTASTTTR